MMNDSNNNRTSGGAMNSSTEDQPKEDDGDDDGRAREQQQQQEFERSDQADDNYEMSSNSSHGSSSSSSSSDSSCAKDTAAGRDWSGYSADCSSNSDISFKSSSARVLLQNLSVGVSGADCDDGDGTNHGTTHHQRRQQQLRQRQQQQRRKFRTQKSSSEDDDDDDDDDDDFNYNYDQDDVAIHGNTYGPTTEDLRRKREQQQQATATLSAEALALLHATKVGNDKIVIPAYSAVGVAGGGAVDSSNTTLQEPLPQLNGIRIAHPMDPRIDLSMVNHIRVPVRLADYALGANNNLNNNNHTAAAIHHFPPPPAPPPEMPLAAMGTTTTTMPTAASAPAGIALTTLTPHPQVMPPGPHITLDQYAQMIEAVRPFFQAYGFPPSPARQQQQHQQQQVHAASFAAAAAAVAAAHAEKPLGSDEAPAESEGYTSFFTTTHTSANNSSDSDKHPPHHHHRSGVDDRSVGAHSYHHQQQQDSTRSLQQQQQQQHKSRPSSVDGGVNESDSSSMVVLARIKRKHLKQDQAGSNQEEGAEGEEEDSSSNSSQKRRVRIDQHSHQHQHLPLLPQPPPDAQPGPVNVHNNNNNASQQEDSSSSSSSDLQQQQQQQQHVPGAAPAPQQQQQHHHHHHLNPHNRFPEGPRLVSESSSSAREQNESSNANTTSGSASGGNTGGSGSGSGSNIGSSGSGQGSSGSGNEGKGGASSEEMAKDEACTVGGGRDGSSTSDNAPMDEPHHQHQHHYHQRLHGKTAVAPPTDSMMVPQFFADTGAYHHQHQHQHQPQLLHQHHQVQQQQVQQLQLQQQLLQSEDQYMDDAEREKKIQNKKRKRMNMRREYESKVQRQMESSESGGDFRELVLKPGQPVTLDQVLSFSKTARIVIQAAPPFLVVHANAAYSRLTGIDAHAAIGKPISSLLSIAEEMSKVGTSTSLYQESLTNMLGRSVPAAATGTTTAADLGRHHQRNISIPQQARAAMPAPPQADLGNVRDHLAAVAAGRANAASLGNDLCLERLLAASGFGRYHIAQVAGKLHQILGRNVTVVRPADPTGGGGGLGHHHHHHHHHGDEGSHGTSSITSNDVPMNPIVCRMGVSPVVSCIDPNPDSAIITDKDVDSHHHRNKKRKPLQGPSSSITSTAPPLSSGPHDVHRRGSLTREMHSWSRRYFRHQQITHYVIQLELATNDTRTDSAESLSSTSAVVDPIGGGLAKPELSTLQQQQLQPASLQGGADFGGGGGDNESEDRDDQESGSTEAKLPVGAIG